MKTILRTSLPEQVKYNGRTYTRDTTLDKDFLINRKEHLRIALESTGKVVVLVKVLARNLRGKNDLGGKPYQPSQFLFTAPKQGEYQNAFDNMMQGTKPALDNLVESIKPQ